MSLQSQWMLENDPSFAGRVRAAVTNQANNWKSSGHAGAEAAALAVLKGDSNVIATFTRLIAAGPGIADKVDVKPGDEGEGGGFQIDSSQVDDNEISNLANTSFDTVARIFYTDDGSPK